MFPVRYELKLFTLFRKNSALKILIKIIHEMEYMLTKYWLENLKEA
jgi:hypothetical protein